MIQGYPDEPSAFPGATVNFHVSTDAPEFRVDFCRQGVTLDFKLSTEWMNGTFADNHEPDQDWNVSTVRRDGKAVEGWPAYPVVIPSDWDTGVYIAMFVEGDGSHNPQPPLPDTTTPDARTGKALIVVKNPVPGVDSQVLYKVPYFTYQRYNATLYQAIDGSTSGGSGYQGFWVTLHRPGGGTGGTPWDVMDRFFNPPNLDVFDMASFRQTFVHWDAKFVSWLESQGLAIDYCTDLDVHLDADGSLLSPYALVLSVGHDEYYSAEMRDNLEAYVANGGNIAFFSGNTCYYRLVFPNPGSLVNITEVGKWAELGRPEDSLTGVGFRHGGERNYPVPANDGEKVGYTVQHTSLWPFEDTGLQENDTFGRDECIVGYECDGTPYDLNAQRPVTPSFKPEDQTPDGFVILGTGVTPVGWQITGAATMGMYTRSGTAFTGATTDWPRVVWQGEPRTVQITRNVLNRLGGNRKGVATIGSIPNIIACDGFYSSDDGDRHAIAGGDDGSVTEVFFNPQVGVGQAQLASLDGLVDLGAFYSDDDQFRHVIAATADGSIWEIFYSPKAGQGQTVLANIPDATRISGFYSPDDRFRHAIVATADGRVIEVFYNPDQGQGQAVLGTFQDIVDIGSFFSPDDRFRHVLVGTADGNVTEIYYNPDTGINQAVIANIPGLSRVSGYYAAGDRFFNRRVQVATSGGRIHEVRYQPRSGIMRAVLFNTTGVVDLGAFYSADDDFRHTVLGMPTGDIQELFFKP